MEDKRWKVDKVAEIYEKNKMEERGVRVDLRC